MESDPHSIKLQTQVPTLNGSAAARRFSDFMKRCLDITLSLLFLFISSPVMLCIWLTIRLTSPGPVIYRQKRVGKGGRLFTMLKFRTMKDNAPDLRNPDGSTFNSDNDQRVTKVGRRLRQASLDELPQFINVLRGEMSIVGPRPDLPDAVAHYRTQDHARSLVKPGITGWAQIHGRNNLPWETRRDFDLEYVRMASIMLDMKIILLTFFFVFSGSGVYVKADTTMREPSPVLSRRSNETR